MKPLSIFLLAGMLFTTAASVQAQEQVDKKAKTILDELSTKTKSYTSIKSEFSFTFSNKEGKVTETQNGTVYLKGDKYKLELKGQDIYSDGKTMWTHVKDAKEVQINNFDKNAKGITPQNVFTMYESGFNYKYEKEEKGQHVINLYPKSPDKEKYHTIKLMVDKVKKQITSVKVMMKDGTSQVITVKTFTPNGQMNDTMFLWDKKAHPGVEEIDLRDEPTGKN
jgi:outer membrane lipoprotein-sorting protein